MSKYNIVSASLKIAVTGKIKICHRPTSKFGTLMYFVPSWALGAVIITVDYSYMWSRARHILQDWNLTNLRMSDVRSE